MSEQPQKTFEHHQANAIGLLDERFDKDRPLVHFRGIKYASIPERFASPVLEIRQRRIELQATHFGPRCPQIPVDVRDLMQIPKQLESYPADLEDEFECLNLNITLPANSPSKLPVLIWIYGGAQIVSFSTSAQRLCETGPLVAQSIASSQPIIVVNPNYRLNVLAYGDGTPSCERNLHVQDLQAAVRWVYDNISDFGGDTSQITVAGESAGSILTHALCLTLPPSLPIARAILCSGSLGTSRFQPASFFSSTLSRILTTARTIAAQQAHPDAETLTLRTMPTSLLIASMAANALNSIPLQTPSDASSLPPPHEAFSRLSALMIGDCEFEGILWLAGIRLIPSSSIRTLFLGSNGDNNASLPSPATQRLISTYLESPSPSAGHAALGLSPEQAAALSFMSDYLFHFPNHHIVSSLLRLQKSSTASATTTTTTTSIATTTSPKTQVYTYLFDEPNPFSTSTQHTRPGTGVPRAHHAVDLLALFNGYGSDYPPNSPFIPVADAFRTKILAFVNGAQPWSPTSSAASAASAAQDEKQVLTYDYPYAYAFGPQGDTGTITAEQYAQRRRTEAFAVMREVGEHAVDAVFARLMAAIAKETVRALAEMGVQGSPPAQQEQQEQHQRMENRGAQARCAEDGGAKL